MSGNSWVGKHKEELLAAAAMGTIAAVSGGAGLGLLGGLGAAGEGAAAGGLAGGLGAGAADEVMGGALLSGMAPQAGGTGIASAMMQAGHPVDAMTTAAKGGLMNMMGEGNYNAMANGASGFGKAANMAGQMGLLSQPQQPQMGRMPQQGQQSLAPGVQSMQQMYGLPIEEQRRRMMMGGFLG